MQLLNIQPRKCNPTKSTTKNIYKQGLSPYENPFLKDLLVLERQSHRRRLQRPKPGAPQNSLLLDLPPELRNTIYSLVLTNQEHVLVDPNSDVSETGDRFEPDDMVIKEPGFLRTCQMFRKEATTMYYSANAFYSIQCAKMLRWIKGIGPEKRALLKDVRGNGSFGDLFTSMNTVTGPYTLSWLLIDVEGFEAALKDKEAAVRDDVCRVYLSIDGPQISFTRSEIRAVMGREQWRVYEKIKIRRERERRGEVLG